MTAGQLHAKIVAVPSRNAVLLGIAVSCLLAAWLLAPYAISAYHLEVGGQALEKAKAFRENPRG